MIRLLLIAVASASSIACANRDAGHSKEEFARAAYYACLKSAASNLQNKPLSIEQIGNLAVVRCERQRNTFTQTLISEISDTKGLTCNDSEAKIPCELRDSFERRYLKTIGDEIATERGFPLEKESLY